MKFWFVVDGVIVKVRLRILDDDIGPWVSTPGANFDSSFSGN